MKKSMSMHEVVHEILTDPKVNMVRFSKGKSEASVEAAIRVMAGETLRDESMGHTRLFSPKIVGLTRDNLFITVCRDKSTRLPDGSFAYRTIPIASPVMGQRVHSLEILYNFESDWKTIDLTGRSVFPNLPASKGKWFAEMMEEVHLLRHRKSFLTNALTSLKKKLGKDKEVTALGHRFHWVNPEGMKEVVVDQDGVQVKAVSKAYDNGAILLPQLPKPTFKKIVDTSEIVRVYLERSEISNKLYAISELVRPFELGLIERSGAMTMFSVGGINFEIKRHKVKSYDLPSDTMEKIENGEWDYKEMPKDRGAWQCDPLVVPASNIADPKPEDTALADV